MLKTAKRNLFGIKHPIIQEGMTYLGTTKLVSAVSAAGGLGIGAELEEMAADGDQ